MTWLQMVQENILKRFLANIHALPKTYNLEQKVNNFRGFRKIWKYNSKLLILKSRCKFHSDSEAKYSTEDNSL